MSLDPEEKNFNNTNNETHENRKKKLKNKYFVNPKNLDSRFFKACAEGNLEIVKEFVERGFDLKMEISPKEITDDKDLTYRSCNGFQFACLEGNLHVVQFLLQNGFVLVGKNMVYKSFMCATQSKNIELVKFLVNLGTGQKIVFSHYFCESCRLGDENMANFYLKFVKINVANMNGKTAFHYACESKEDDVNFLKWLIKKGININAQSIHYHETGFHFACKSGNLNIVEFLVKQKYIDLNQQDSDGKTGFHEACVFACKSGNLNILKFLVEQKNIDLNKQDNGGKTAFLEACVFGNLNVVKFLVENIAQKQDIDQGFNRACEKGNFNMVKYLGEQGANCQNVSFGSQTLAASAVVAATPLFYACETMNVNVAQYLIQNGCDVHHTNQNGRNVLEHICKLKYNNVCMQTHSFILTLIEAGVNIDRNRVDVPETMIFIIQNRIVEIVFVKNKIFETFPPLVAKVISDFTMLPITNTSLQNLLQILDWRNIQNYVRLD